MKLIRTLKAIVGTAVTWGTVWSLLSIPALVSVLRTDLPVPGPSTLQQIWSWATQVWLYTFAQGAVVGAGFALLLLLASLRMKSIRRLTFPGLGLLGAAATSGIGVLVIGPGMGLVGGLILAAIGASTAMASLAVARRAPDQVLTAPEDPRALT